MGFKQRKFNSEVLTAKVSVRRNTKQLMEQDKNKEAKQKYPAGHQIHST